MILVLGAGGLSLMSRSSRLTLRKRGCGTAVTGTTGIAAYETYMTYGYLICAECEDGGAAIRRY